MAYYFTDSSALAKRYMVEAGSDWVEALCKDVANSIIIAEITLAEVASTFARAARTHRITNEQRVEYLDLFTGDCDRQYQLVPIHRTIIDGAVHLTQQYRLRGYDSIQLACALNMNAALSERGLAILTFLSADADLLAAAISAGLTTENPNDH